METGKRNLGSIIVTICVLAMLSLFSIYNWKLAQGPIQELVRKEVTFSEFVDSIQSAYLSDDLKGKNSFINLNGFFARLTGRRVYNEVVILDNGMLSETIPKKNVESFAENIVQFKEFLSGRETEPKFVYVQAPYKESMEGEMFPEGAESYANENVDELLKLLAAKNVNTLDLRPLLSKTPEMVSEYFFGTDHHWNFKGAFVAYQEISKYISQLYPEKQMDLTYTDDAQWQPYTLEEWSLGSKGKRVGIYFGGVDDVTYYVPKFESQNSLMVPSRSLVYKGDYKKANIRSVYTKEKNYFGASTYCIYGGGNYALARLRNMNAPVELKLLLIGDSFSLPVYSFLSAIFSEIDVIDMRYYTDGSVAEYVDMTNPDMVMMLINPSVIKNNSEYADLGVEDLLARKTNNTEQEKVVTYDSIEVTSKEEYEVIPLESGKKYTLNFDDVVYKGEMPSALGVSVYNKTTEKVAVSTLFDIEFQKEREAFQWSFITPELGEGELQLLLYTGIPNKTKEIDAVYQNVTLSSCDWK